MRSVLLIGNIGSELGEARPCAKSWVNDFLSSDGERPSFRGGARRWFAFSTWPQQPPHWLARST